MSADRLLCALVPVLLLLPALGSETVRSGRHAAEHRLEGGPWPAPVAGHVPVEPGEHPRLFFRRTDLAELRRRAETPEGKLIIARLRQLLNGSDGETMTTVFNPAKTEYNPTQEKSVLSCDRPGVFTISHAAGYGFLYQLTGEKKYAEFGKQCFIKGLDEEVRDRDSRYSLFESGALRVGPALAWYALGYDLCYDGWDEAFRRHVAQKLLNHDAVTGRKGTIDALAQGLVHHPACNHWGGEVSGPAMVALATMGDPEADPERVKTLLEYGKASTLKQLTIGIGDYGFFGGGTGPGVITTDTAFVPLLQAWRVAAGLDYLTPREVGEWLTLQWIHGSVVPNPDPAEARPLYPVRGTYQHNYFSRKGMSGSGAFCQGFGTISEQYKPALLWLYNRSFKQSDFAAGAPWDSINPYPHRSILALVNGPFGVQEADPGKVLPKIIVDRHWNLVQIRERWQDAQDLLISVLTERSGGHYRCAPDVQLIHDGQVLTAPAVLVGKVDQVRELGKGYAIKTDQGCLGIDLSGASGAEILLVWRGGKKVYELMGEEARTAYLAKHKQDPRFITVFAEDIPDRLVGGEEEIPDDELFLLEHEKEARKKPGRNPKKGGRKTPADPPPEDAVEVLYHVMSYGGRAPKVVQVGDRLIVSGQGVRMEDGWVVFGE